jgi:hypothetical protein
MSTRSHLSHGVGPRPPRSGGLQCSHVLNVSGPHLAAWDGSNVVMCSVAPDIPQPQRLASDIPQPQHVALLRTSPLHTEASELTHVSWPSAYYML